MNINATLIFQMIVFFILAWFSMKFVWPPIMKAIDERREKIAAGLAAADKGKENLALAESRAKSLEEQAKKETSARLLEAEKQATAILEQARVEAEQERARIVAQSLVDIELEAQKARQTLREEVAALAVKGAEQILKREIDAAAHAELLAQLKTQI